MKAIRIKSYGAVDVLELTEEHPKPAIADLEVLVKVHACGLNPIDWKIRKGDLKWVIPKRFPRILGVDIAGVIVEVGNNIHDFAVGDEVFAMLDLFSGGGNGEYVATKGLTLSKKPNNLSFQEASAVPLAGITALQALRDKGKIKAGQDVLIIGAGGGVGTFAIQIAKAYGATVTAVASESKRKLCLSLGADNFIDYQSDPLTSIKDPFDIIFDVASAGSFFKMRHLLKRHGKYVDTLPSLKGIFLDVFTRVIPGPTYRLIMAKSDKKDLEQLKEYIEAGQLKVMIDRVFPLEETAQAHRYSEEGHAAGKIILTL